MLDLITRYYYSEHTPIDLFTRELAYLYSLLSGI